MSTKAQLTTEIAALREEIAALQLRLKHVETRYHRNAQVINQIPRAKRQAGFPLKSVFFRDVWPVVLETYLEKKKPRRTKSEPS